MQLFDYEKEHLQQLRKLLPECTVLLRSDGTFPLEKPERVALFGEGARHTIKGGTGSGDVNSRYFVNVEEGLAEAGFTITSRAWLDAFDAVLEQEKKKFYAGIRARAKAKHTPAILESMGAVMKSPQADLPLEGEGDLAVYVLARNSGEGSDRTFSKGDILLSDGEKRDILALNAKYPKFLLVLNVGGPVDLSPLGEVKNILLLSQLGVETGSALADLMLGKAYPSGKLASSWAFESDQPAVGDFGENDDTRYREGIYVGYRYFDSMGIRNEFPFGFGLSYTAFTLSDNTVCCKDGNVCVEVTVTNIGCRSGKETVQVYVSVPNGKLDQPYQTLAAFAKTAELAAGSSQRISLSFELGDIAGFDEESSAYILEKGDYLIRIGTSSVNTEVCGVLSLTASVPVLKVRSCCGKPDFQDWKPEVPVSGEVHKGLVPLVIEADSIPSAVVEYDLEQEIDPFIEKLSDEELAFINIGRFDAKAGAMSVIGAAGARVAGAAGETSGILEKRGFPVMIMADGPAGLRLTQIFFRDKSGTVFPIGSTMPAGFEELMPKPAVLLSKLLAKRPRRKSDVEFQYCTALPIGTAIAQSFNCELAERCGDIVGSEMQRFGVHLWLAPALNIHRDPRCGRNFEYYSEDPLVSGLMAAALTRGVQNHPGCGATIKHYAANNQETARYTNNSQVSERAMREIYLRGFGICVKRARPCAVMTSYNLLNGVHTSERRDLTEDILRAEFGFSGIVMTDWVISMMSDPGTKYRTARAKDVAAAGGDLFMPGCQMDYDAVLDGIKADPDYRRQVLINASRVYRMALKLCRKS